MHPIAHHQHEAWRRNLSFTSGSRSAHRTLIAHCGGNEFFSPSHVHYLVPFLLSSAGLSLHGR